MYGPDGLAHQTQDLWAPPWPMQARMYVSMSAFLITCTVSSLILWNIATSFEIPWLKCIQWCMPLYLRYLTHLKYYFDPHTWHVWSYLVNINGTTVGPSWSLTVVTRLTAVFALTLTHKSVMINCVTYVWFKNHHTTNHFVWNLTILELFKLKDLNFLGSLLQNIRNPLQL